MEELALGPRSFQDRADISAETLDMFKIWLTLLTRWNSKINLVGPRTLEHFWLRHALDSHQVYGLLSQDTKTIIDLGAGAGFPGIALAIMMRDTPGARVTMVESNGKKCNFLRTVIRELSLPAQALQQRAEDIPAEPYDVVTARAFAPLPRLLSYAQPFWSATTQGVFPKGESWETEINNAKSDWAFDVKTVDSQTDDRARILILTGLAAKNEQQQKMRGQSSDQKSA